MPFNHNYKTPKVIAEIGCNHMGKIEIAKELIELAKSCNADVAKFQARDNKLLLTEEQYNAPHPVQENSYGNTYGDIEKPISFTLKSYLSYNFTISSKAISPKGTG